MAFAVFHSESNTRLYIVVSSSCSGVLISSATLSFEHYNQSLRDELQRLRLVVTASDFTSASVVYDDAFESITTSCNMEKLRR